MARYADIVAVRDALYEADAITMKGVRILNQFPTISPDEARGVGEWIDYQQGRWVYAQCSECGTVHDVRSNYCPSCGARMSRAEAEKAMGVADDA